MGKALSSCHFFVKPFEILEGIGYVTYRIVFLPILSCIYDFFHVFVLRQYIPDVTHVLDWDALEVEDKQLSLEHICILQHQRLTLRGWDIEQVRVQWDLSNETSATWEDAT